METGGKQALRFASGDAQESSPLAKPDRKL